MSTVFLNGVEFPVLASAPASPVAGMAYVRSSDYHLLVYNGTAWVDQAAGAGSGAFVQSDLAEISADTSTTSTTFVDLLTLNMTTGAGFLLIDFSVSGSASSTAARNIAFQLLVDGTPVRGAQIYATSQGSYGAGIAYRVAVAAGAHAIKIQWRTNAATARIRPVTTIAEHAALRVCEVTT